MRVYLPASLPLLRDWLAAGRVPVSTGYAVTPGLREWYADADSEELEYAATARAARASLRLLGPADPARRVVLVLTADRVLVRDELEQGAVTLTAPAPWAAVDAALVDDAAAAEAVARAAQSIHAADLGEEDAELAVGDAQDHALGWYARQEIADL